MIVYTGYFTKTNKYTEAGLTPISIAGRKPEGIDVEEWKFLAPSYDIFMSWKNKDIDNETYIRRFIFERFIFERLFLLDKERLRRMLMEVKNPILLCYEKPESFCHRHIVAEYITKVLGIPTEEYII